jgi:hypothetical protein
MFLFRRVGATPCRSFMSIHTNDKTRIATLLLNSPPVNTLSVPFLSNLKQTLTDIQKQNIKGLIIASMQPVQITNSSMFSAQAWI